MRVVTDSAEYFEFCLQMECAAAESYLRFVYDSWDQAMAVQRHLALCGLLESSPPHGRILLRGDEPIGMVSGVPGDELRRIRLRAAFALEKEPALRPDDATRHRMQLANRVLISPQVTDYYSSKLGVSPSARGTGAGLLLMRYVSEEGEQRAFKRVLGEVHPENRPMMQLMCEKVGWKRIGQQQVTDPGTGRMLEYAHLAYDCRPPTGS